MRPLLIALVIPAALTAQYNPVNEGLRKAISLGGQIQAMRANQEAAATLAAERERMEYEKRKLAAETELLIEQRRALERAATPEPISPTPTRELTDGELGEVTDLFLAKYPDAAGYRDDIGAIETVLGDAYSNKAAFYLYLTGLYVLAKHIRSGALATTPAVDEPAQPETGAASPIRRSLDAVPVIPAATLTGSSAPKARCLAYPGACAN